MELLYDQIQVQSYIAIHHATSGIRSRGSFYLEERFKLYVNAAPDDASALTFSGKVHDNAQSDLYIGAWVVRAGFTSAPGAPEYTKFIGALDEVRLSNTARAAANQLLTTDITYVYNTANQLVKEYPTGNQADGEVKTYTYDKNGNQTQVISTLNGTTLRKVSMTYDLFNRNTAWTLSKPDAAGVLTPARTTTYTYRGAQWHRTAITTADGEVKYLYDGANVIADIGTGGALQKTYVTPMLDQNLSVTTYTPTSTGIDTATYYYNADDRQSVHNLTTSTGAIAATYDYTAFGERTETITFPQLSIVNSPLSIASQRYTYTGRELNPYSGDYYFRYRTYNAGFGAFTARDPLGYVDGTSLNAGYFARWMGLDPTGLEQSAEIYHRSVSMSDDGLTATIEGRAWMPNSEWVYVPGSDTKVGDSSDWKWVVYGQFYSDGCCNTYNKYERWELWFKKMTRDYFGFRLGLNFEDELNKRRDNLNWWHRWNLVSSLIGMIPIAGDATSFLLDEAILEETFDPTVNVRITKMGLFTGKEVKLSYYIKSYTKYEFVSQHPSTEENCPFKTTNMGN